MPSVLGTYLQRFGSRRLYRHRGNWKRNKTIRIWPLKRAGDFKKSVTLNKKIWQNLFFFSSTWQEWSWTRACCRRWRCTAEDHQVELRTSVSHRPQPQGSNEIYYLEMWVKISEFKQLHGRHQMKQKHYKSPWIKQRLCVQLDMNQSERGQKINNLLTQPGREAVIKTENNRASCRKGSSHESYALRNRHLGYLY